MQIKPNALALEHDRDMHHGERGLPILPECDDSNAQQRI